MDEDYLHALEIMGSLTLPMVMYAAVKLDLFGIIARAGNDRQLSVAEIVAHLPAASNPDAPSMLDRMLRFLATYSVVSCSTTEAEDGGVERKYGLSPVGRYFVPDENGVSLAPLVAFLQDKVIVDSWFKLEEAILEGGNPFNKVHGMHAFEYPSVDPRFNEVFNKAMYEHSIYVIKKILMSYKGFDNIQRLVDVGGGLGHTLGVITSQYPSIKGINFDLPHVIEHASPYPAVEHVAGDMFESVPGGDAIFMKWILHDWSDDRCLKLLRNCYKALPDVGKVIVVDTNVTEEPEATCRARAISQMDVSMLNNNPGGKERTRREFEALAKEAGFASINFVCCVACYWVMELYK